MMMNKWSGFLPITVALIIALGGSILTYSWIKKQTSLKQSSTGKADAVSIAVASHDLPWGTQIKKEDIQMVPFLKASLTPDYFTDISTLEGRVAIAPLRQKEPILESRLAPTSITTGGISAVVTPGKRALAVKGDKVIGVSGFIKPGNRVDVLVTLTDPRDDREINKLVLQDILVLATGTEVAKEGKGEKDTAPVDVYTLEVTPEDGEKLALAATEGKLQFALRNSTDGETVYTKGTSIPDALSSYSLTKPTAATAKAIGKAPVAATTVQVIKGTQSGSVSF
jgi:pilus assembly protein CpaB